MKTEGGKAAGWNEQIKMGGVRERERDESKLREREREVNETH